MEHENGSETNRYGTLNNTRLFGKGNWGRNKERQYLMRETSKYSFFINSNTM